MTTMTLPPHREADPTPGRSGAAALRARLARPERPLRLLQAHDGLSARVAASATLPCDGQERRFDGIWVGSLADAASRAQPDEEVVDLSSRLASLEWMLEASELPAVFDADTGGWPEQAKVIMRRLARLGAAAVVFEDKAGHKRNSLGPDRHQQSGASIEAFQAKLRASIAARPTGGPLLVARIESLVRGDSVADAVERAHAYLEAGADALLVHGAGPTAAPVLEVVRTCRSQRIAAPIFAVPTAYPDVHEPQLADAGVDVVVYANQLLRAALAAMQRAAAVLLREGRGAAVEPSCVPFADLLAMIEPRR